MGSFEGLRITIPANWYLTEQDVGELALRPDDEHGLILWKDVRVVTTTRAMGPANEIVKRVARTPDAFVKWLTNNDPLTVIEPPVASSIGGTTGVVFSVQVSKRGNLRGSGVPFELSVRRPRDRADLSDGCRLRPLPADRDHPGAG